MRKLLGFVFLVLYSLGALGQKPTTLEIFTNPDGAFEFAYPDTYDLLVGERILKATQGRNSGIPVCDFATALVCVIYPIEGTDSTKLEAAGFSVEAVPNIASESECVAYADRLARPQAGQAYPSFSLNGRSYSHIFVKRATTGHLQSSDLFITFEKDRCYELRVSISLSDESSARQATSKSLEVAEAYSARQSLELVLASFNFK